ncbi:hypothetical protein RBSWK_03233 [Rhodopirellula baltica SWK14]|uniref:Uncharacterized protein n=1 Tax=Rhodopirellula baltica SWK14 TaxID=993516 RepID=L7CI76_RHOBT|nr:hypothetical protein RBSWK_03233 [Rhodopirellula baltica SWK14]
MLHQKRSKDHSPPLARGQSATNAIQSPPNPSGASEFHLIRRTREK